MDLLEYMEEKNKAREAPLAARMRPQTLAEMVGQEHIIGKGKLLYRAIMADKLSSIILYGPPGTGKTTLAKVIANTTSADFKQVNATIAGKKDLEQVISDAKYSFGAFNRRTILFIDEIHRFNKGQQDYLLPYVEDGTVVLIGATTENPYFEVNGALLSRSRIFELKPLSKEALLSLLDRAVTDEARGLGAMNMKVDADAADFLIEAANGDARAVLGALELAALTTDRSEDGCIRLTLEIAAECIQKRVVRYDKAGDNHYDAISAFIESMKHSDPDATLYYLARMIEAGEDPKYVARRIIVCASEDVGLANSQALNVAVNAFLAVERVGMPEGAKVLAHAALYVACSDKSDTASRGLREALECVQKTGDIPIPAFLQDVSYSSAKKLGRGIGLLDIHRYSHHYVEQRCLPEELGDCHFFHLTGNGVEKEIAQYFQKIKDR